MDSVPSQPADLPGLSPTLSYRIDAVQLTGIDWPVQDSFTSLHGPDLVLPGAAITATGFAVPPMAPGDVLLLRIVQDPMHVPGLDSDLVRACP